MACRNNFLWSHYFSISRYVKWAIFKVFYLILLNESPKWNKIIQKEKICSGNKKNLIGEKAFVLLGFENSQNLSYKMKCHVWQHISWQWSELSSDTFGSLKLVMGLVSSPKQTFLEGSCFKLISHQKSALNWHDELFG